GINIKGDYNQKAIGASFEAGRYVKLAQDTWVQPYGQLIWLQAEGKEVKLSNEMAGDISPYTSLRSEIGMSIGHELSSGTSTQMMTYIKTAWLREYIDNNHTIINKQHKFKTDLSGNSGKLGIGLNSFISENLNFYVEAHYLRGKKTKQSLQGVLGLRYSF
ncbi:MAG: autotransporter outer membrane beta-barrel domain-containing protein, partial [Bartonella sp.]|nr:autotransporter outer membrane beta-barrel domain-containing protein [Bartonella sp.]